MPIDEVLKHFEIGTDEIPKDIPISASTNSQFMRESMGIEFILKCSEAFSHTGEGKVRIIIDYDKDFPKILSRVIFR